MYLACLALLSISIAECTIDFSRPVNPVDYQQAFQQGFNANFLKYPKRPPAKTNYREGNIADIYAEGFRNLRIRVNPGTYQSDYLNQMLIKLKEIVNDCIDNQVLPTVTWVHHEAEAYATEEDFKHYLDFWRTVAEEFKDTSYRLSFSLYTELGTDVCFKKDECEGPRRKSPCCSESLSVNIEKYHKWTSEVIKVIRGTGGNNEKRIIIVAPPVWTDEGLQYLVKAEAPYLADENYVLAEWHTYASGPKKFPNHPNYWTGSGTEEQKAYLRRSLQVAKDFTEETGIPTYVAEWCPIDNQYGLITEDEAVAFARFFVSELKKAQIPWSMNEISKFYNTIKGQWYIEKEQVPRHNRTNVKTFNMERILDAIIEEK